MSEGKQREESCWIYTVEMLMGKSTTENKQFCGMDFDRIQE